MTEWLTTGEMIDRLKVREVAELEEDKCIPTNYGLSYSHVFKDEYGDIKWCKKDGSHPSSSPLQIYGHVIQWKWRILPTYVNFEEAMKALKEGKRVRLLSENGKLLLSPFEKEHIIQNCDGIGRSFQSWFEGKWAIEGDTP